MRGVVGYREDSWQVPEFLINRKKLLKRKNAVGKQEDGERAGGFDQKRTCCLVKRLLAVEKKRKFGEERTKR